MAIRHTKTNNIPDPTQAELDAQIALGNYPPGTLLANIALASDWNADHTAPDIADVTGLQAELDSKYSASNPPPASSAAFVEVEKNIGSVPKLAGRFTVTGLSGLTIGKPVIISQAVGPYTGKGTRADEAEMDGLIVKAAVTAADTITAYWNSATFVKGNFKFNYLVGA
jgi:hypothetical protein